MTSLFKRIFGRGRRPVREVVEHPVLGRLVYSADGDGWESQTGHGGIPFRFFIAGDLGAGADEVVPDGALIKHAEAIALDPTEFAVRIQGFLAREAQAQSRLNGLVEEVSLLEVDAVCLMWPDRPDDGMIQFRGPADDRRLWRCDYVQREPKWLGFDT
jgi:hypothetical protein